MGDYDSYDPYEKKLAWNYKIYYPYKVVCLPKESILKKKPSEDGEGENMKLYKTGDKPEVFILGKGDTLYHHIDLRNEEANSLLGDYANDLEIMSQIPEEQIGFSLYTKKSFWQVLSDLIVKLKGR